MRKLFEYFWPKIYWQASVDILERSGIVPVQLFGVSIGASFYGRVRLNYGKN